MNHFQFTIFRAPNLVGQDTAMAGIRPLLIAQETASFGVDKPNERLNGILLGANMAQIRGVKSHYVSRSSQFPPGLGRATQLRNVKVLNPFLLHLLAQNALGKAGLTALWAFPHINQDIDIMVHQPLDEAL
jgi:hypothetical protein